MEIPNTLFSVEPSARRATIARLIASSTPRKEFFLMMILATMMASFGLASNNAAVIIGGMLLAPLLSPILSLAMSIVIADFRLMHRSVWTLVKACLLSLGLSIIVSFFVPLKEVNHEILLRITPDLITVYVALAAGIGASFAYAKPTLTDFLPGTMLAIALVTPLSTVGIGVASLANKAVSVSKALEIVVNGSQTFGLNILCMIFASVIIFSLVGFHGHKYDAEVEIAKEDKKMSIEESAERAAQARVAAEEAMAAAQAAEESAKLADVAEDVAHIQLEKNDRGGAA